jgi:hypothetical protein
MRYLWLACVLCIIGCDVDAPTKPNAPTKSQAKPDSPATALTQVHEISHSAAELVGKEFLFEGQMAVNTKQAIKIVNRWRFALEHRYTVPATKFEPAHQAVTTLEIQFTDEAEEKKVAEQYDAYMAAYSANQLAINQGKPTGKPPVPPTIKVRCKGERGPSGNFYAWVKRID